MSGAGSTPAASGTRAFWALRVLETATLVAILAGIGLFAYSLVDIARIEMQPGATNVAGARREIPPTAYPGLALFFGGMLALQGVRVVLGRYRRHEGAALAQGGPVEGDDAPRRDAPPLYSEDGPALAPEDDTGEA